MNKINDLDQEDNIEFFKHILEKCDQVSVKIAPKNSQQGSKKGPGAWYFGVLTEIDGDYGIVKPKGHRKTERIHLSDIKPWVKGIEMNGDTDQAQEVHDKIKAEKEKIKAEKLEAAKIKAAKVEAIRAIEIEKAKAEAEAKAKAKAEKEEAEAKEKAEAKALEHEAILKDRHDQAIKSLRQQQVDEFIETYGSKFVIYTEYEGGFKFFNNKKEWVNDFIEARLYDNYTIKRICSRLNNSGTYGSVNNIKVKAIPKMIGLPIIQPEPIQPEPIQPKPIQPPELISKFESESPVHNDSVLVETPAKEEAISNITNLIDEYKKQRIIVVDAEKLLFEEQIKLSYIKAQIDCEMKTRIWTRHVGNNVNGISNDHSR